LSDSNKKLSGADIFFECLKKENVKVIFGYPGGATLKLYEHLYDVDFLKHVLVRHEQGATHMAEGYAKATGKVGVVLVTSGPGATNTVTGIADAYMLQWQRFLPFRLHGHQIVLLKQPIHRNY